MQFKEPSGITVDKYRGFVGRGKAGAVAGVTDGISQQCGLADGRMGGWADSRNTERPPIFGLRPPLLLPVVLESAKYFPYLPFPPPILNLTYLLIFRGAIIIENLAVAYNEKHTVLQKRR